MQVKNREPSLYLLQKAWTPLPLLQDFFGKKLWFSTVCINPNCPVKGVGLLLHRKYPPWFVLALKLRIPQLNLSPICFQKNYFYSIIWFVLFVLYLLYHIICIVPFVSYHFICIICIIWITCIICIICICMFF